MKGMHVRMAHRNGLSALALAMLLTWQNAWSTSVTLNLKDADLSALIGTVAEVTGTNFIVDPRVKGKITVVSSKPMESDEVYQVFLSILKVHGYAAVPSGSVVKIVPDVNAKSEGVPSATDKEPGRGDEVVTRVIEVNNVSAAQLVPILRPLIPQQGHMAAYPGTNVLIISDRAENIERLVSIIRRMDQQSDNEIEVMPLQYASAAEVVRIIGALNRPQAGMPQAAGGGEPTVIADERTNSVLIGGDKSDRLRLRMVISHLDTPLDRGGNTHVIYLKYAKAEDLVKVLTGVGTSIAKEQAGGQAAAGGGGAAARPQGDLSIQSDDASNALVITAGPEEFRSLEAVIRQLDIRRAQVHIEAVIAEITSKNAVELGVQWRATNDLSGSGVIGGTNFSSGTSINAVATNPLSAGDGLSLGYFEGTAKLLGVEILNLGALVKALASDADNNILSTPNLVTLDNQEAEIVVAQNVPFRTGTYDTGATGQGGATNPFETIERQDVGLTLKVKPQINEGDDIKLEIEQEISDVSNEPVEGASDIVTNKRSIKTTVMVDDKQMIVLGGLLSDKVNEGVQKVPLLGDLPVLGNLFKSRRTEKQKLNLMVFIQPAILRDAAYTNEISAGKYNYMRGLQTQVRDNGVNLLPDEEAPLLPDYPYPGTPSATAETQPLPEAPAPSP